MNVLKDPKPNKFLKKPTVIEISSLSNSTLQRLINANKFPRPVRLSANRVGWPADVVYKWIEERQQKANENEQ